MAYNNGFPMTYQQMYPQYQYQQPVQQAQMMTLPTIHAEIIQVTTEAEAAAYPVAAGSTQMFMLRDDSEICIKAAYANGQSALTVFEKRAQKPQQESQEYVTRDEFERRLKELSETRAAAQKGPRNANKEASAE